MSAPRRAAVRLEPADEGMHPDTGERNFNESMYFNFFDPALRLGGFLRVGNRPNEGHAEVTVCLFLPDGRVAFRYERPAIEGNERFDAGGVAFAVERPFERLSARYAGQACLLADPLAMAEPREAFRANPFVPVEVELAIEGVGPMYGGEPERRREGEMEFARGHYEQHHRARGRVAVDGAAHAFDGFGLRDHSWGPRSWQAPARYRWLTANLGAEFGFMGSVVVAGDGRETRAGFVHRGRERILVRDVRIETDRTGPQQLQEALRARLHCEDGRVLEVEGRVHGMIPLRNRRDGRTTRIAEGMTEWRCEGRTGWGLAEYLDQLGENGLPLDPRD